MLPSHVVLVDPSQLMQPPRPAPSDDELRAKTACNMSSSAAASASALAASGLDRVAIVPVHGRARRVRPRHTTEPIDGAAKLWIRALLVLLHSESALVVVPLPVIFGGRQIIRRFVLRRLYDTGTKASLLRHLVGAFPE